MLWRAVCAAVILGAVIWALVIAAVIVLVPSQTVHYPACPFEDSPGPCVWDAQHQGNGRGTSFFRDSQGGIHPLNGQ